MGVISVLCNHLSCPLCDVSRPAQRCLVVLVLCAAVQRNEGGLLTAESKSPALYLMCAVTSAGHSTLNAAVQVVRARGRSGPVWLFVARNLNVGLDVGLVLVVALKWDL